MTAARKIAPIPTAPVSRTQERRSLPALQSAALALAGQAEASIRELRDHADERRRDRGMREQLAARTLDARARVLQDDLDELRWLMSLRGLES